MDASQNGTPDSRYVQGVEVVSGLFRELVYHEAHDVRGVLNSISMTAYNSKTRIDQHGTSDTRGQASEIDSLEAVKKKLDRIVKATKELDDRVQLLVDLVSEKPVDIVSTLTAFASMLPEITNSDFIEIRFDKNGQGWHPQLSGIHILALLITWVDCLWKHRGKHTVAQGRIEAADEAGGVVELIDGENDRPLLTLSPKGSSEKRIAMVNGAFEAFAAVSDPRLPVVHVVLET